MEVPPTNKKTKLMYTSKQIRVESWNYNRYGRPYVLTTTKGKNYTFPKLVSCNIYIITQLERTLSSPKKITILYDNLDRIHKIENIALSWSETDKYKLVVISLRDGLIFNENVVVNAIENVKRFFDYHNLYKMFLEGPEFTIIVHYNILIDIPREY